MRFTCSRRPEELEYRDALKGCTLKVMAAHALSQENAVALIHANSEMRTDVQVDDEPLGVSLLQESGGDRVHSTSAGGGPPASVALPDMSQAEGARLLVRQAEEKAGMLQVACGSGAVSSQTPIQGASSDVTAAEVRAGATGTLEASSHSAPGGVASLLQTAVVARCAAMQSHAPVCYASAKAVVVVGGESKEVALAQELKCGEVVSYPCDGVNSAYRGDVWLMCDPSSGGCVKPDVSRCFPREGNELCASLLVSLEHTYVKAYVQMSHLVYEYEGLVNSTACQDAAAETYGGRQAPLRLQADDLSTKAAAQTSAMQMYHLQIEAARNAEGRLRSQVALLSTHCQDMDAAVNTLDKMHLAIEALRLCPGLPTLEFHVPLFVGFSSPAIINTTALTDAEVDQKLNKICSGIDAGTSGSGATASAPRAAETSEIQERTIEDMPNLNSASVPLLGGCPGCEGNVDVPGETAQHAAGHARVCWDPDAELGGTVAAGPRKDCGPHGHKVAMCVVERLR